MLQFSHPRSLFRTVERHGTHGIRTGLQRPTARGIVDRHTEIARHGRVVHTLQHDTADRFIAYVRRQIPGREPQITRIMGEPKRFGTHRALLRNRRLHRSGHQKHRIRIERLRPITLHRGENQCIVRINGQHPRRIEAVEPLPRHVPLGRKQGVAAEKHVRGIESSLRHHIETTPRLVAGPHARTVCKSRHPERIALRPDDPVPRPVGLVLHPRAGRSGIGTRFDAHSLSTSRRNVGPATCRQSRKTSQQAQPARRSEITASHTPHQSRSVSST